MESEQQKRVNGARSTIGSDAAGTGATSKQHSASSSARGSLEAIEEMLGRYRPASSQQGSREPSQSGSVQDSQDAVQHAMGILRAAGMADDAGLSQLELAFAPYLAAALESFPAVCECHLVPHKMHNLLD
jgi:hypothetical protein